MREQTVMWAILAKQSENVLPLYLECLQKQTYPSSRIYVYIRANNSTDDTVGILRRWAKSQRSRYAAIVTDFSYVPNQVERFGTHEWNPERFAVLGAIRQQSMMQALKFQTDYYFCADVDNFLVPCALESVVSTGLPIVAPMLTHDSGSLYSNWHGAIDANGYYLDSPWYRAVLGREVRGLIEVPVVHCTYAVRKDAIPHLHYQDGSPLHEYVIFSHSARKAGIPQYLDNRLWYGCLTMDDHVGICEPLMRPHI